MCADTHLILSRLILSAWYSLSVPPSYHILNPEALARSPTVGPRLIHQSCRLASSLCRPRASSLRPQGTGISVWNTQQDHCDPLRARPAELVQAIKVLEVCIKTLLSGQVTVCCISTELRLLLMPSLLLLIIILNSKYFKELCHYSRQYNILKNIIPRVSLLNKVPKNDSSIVQNHYRRIQEQ